MQEDSIALTKLDLANTWVAGIDLPKHPRGFVARLTTVESNAFALLVGTPVEHVDNPSAVQQLDENLLLAILRQSYLHFRYPDVNDLLPDPMLLAPLASLVRQGCTTF